MMPRTIPQSPKPEDRVRFIEESNELNVSERIRNVLATAGRQSLFAFRMDGNFDAECASFKSSSGERLAINHILAPTLGGCIQVWHNNVLVHQEAWQMQQGVSNLWPNKSPHTWIGVLTEWETKIGIKDALRREPLPASSA